MQITSRALNCPASPEQSPNGSPSKQDEGERIIASLTEDAEKYAFLNKCMERFEPARYMFEAMENSGVSFTDAWINSEERFYKKRIASKGLRSHLQRASGP